MSKASIVPRDPEERELFLQRMLSDTGFFCRNVLGMDTDRDQKGNATTQIGKGGVRPYGPHQEVIAFLDDWANPLKHLEAPRFSYKSSMVLGLICRSILAYPDIAILMGMATKELAKERIKKLKQVLETNPVIREFFPDLKCVGSQYSFTVNIRADKTLQSPTLYACSVMSIPTGLRPNLIVTDDIVDDVNCRTDGGLERVRESIRAMLPLRGRDGVFLNVGTPRHDGDAHAYIKEQDGWIKCVHLDVGFEMVQAADGKWDLKGEGRWENLSREFLLSQIRGGMTFSDFMSQYKLRVVAGVHQAFKRHYFQPCSWKDEMANYSGYLLTDTATSESASGALNVLMYVLIDERSRVYIVDLQIGHWPMLEFCNRFLAMIRKWKDKVNHRAELMEVTTVTAGYKGFLNVLSRDQGVPMNIIAIGRSTSDKQKEVRILGTQCRFQAREVWVCNNTVGTTWNDVASVRVLWEPEGHVDPTTGERLPDGELVSQFVRFPYHAKRDIPDTFALVDEIDKVTGQRICFYRKPSKMVDKDATIRQPVEVRSGMSGLGAAQRFYNRAARRLRG